MKSLDKRIAYYTKKVAQFGTIHPSKRRNPYRYNRLIAYKSHINSQIKMLKEELS